MCGIVGAIALTTNGFPYNASGIFSQLLTVDILRGPDSTGYFMVDNTGKVGFGKVASHPIRLMSSQGYVEAMRLMYQRGQVIVGHNRKATVGDVNNQNAHPHHHEHIIMVHNGGLWNHKEHGEFDVDSMAIPKLLAEHEDPKDALAKMHGHFAIVWYNSKTDTLHWARNRDRPLTMAKFGTVMYLGSEQKMLEWILNRQPGNVSAVYEDVTPEVLYSFDLTERKITTSDFKFKAWATTHHHNSVGNSQWSNWREAQARASRSNPPRGLPAAGAEDPNTNTEQSGTFIAPATTVTFRAVSIDRRNASRPVLVGKTLDGAGAVVHYLIKNPEELKGFFESIQKPRNLYRGLTGHTVFRGNSLQVQWLRQVTPVKMYKTWNGEWLTGDDWASVAKGNNCSTCAAPIALRYIKYTSVNFNNGSGKPRIICPECIARRLNGPDVTPAAKANIESGAGCHINDYFAEKEKDLCRLRVVSNEVKSENSEYPVLLLPSTHTK